MSGNPSTYGELHALACSLIGSKFEAGQLFTHVTGKKVFHLSFLGQKSVPEGESQLLVKLCHRRKAGEPLQYLLGEWEFYGLPFKVGRGVLIPRQDTETLVDVALERLRGMQSPQVLDLCSGTGCVAVAIAHSCPEARVTALELDEHAYGYLTQNIKLNSSPVRPLRQDLWDYEHPLPLDLIVSNPPYIPRQAIASLQAEVHYEPRLALDGGSDGLDFYRAIARLYRAQLTDGGWLCLEVGVGQSSQVSDILMSYGFREIGSRNDLTGIPRVVSGRRSVSSEGASPN